MKGIIKRIRYKLAYMLASDWIEDLESRLSGFLCEQTGGMLSKSYYSITTMNIAAADRQQRICDECRRRNDDI